MRSLDELLDRAEAGNLTEEEFEYIVSRIKESKKKEDPELYILIYVLGKSGAVEYRALIEDFLYFPSNPRISKIALNTLINYWELLEDYIAEVRIFLRGVTWDKYEDVRTTAILASGRYLTGYEDKELLEELIKIFMDSSEDETNRTAAYQALAEAMGRSMSEIFGAKEIDFSILEEAQQRLAKCT